MVAHACLFNSGVLMDFCYKVVGGSWEYPNASEADTPVKYILKEKSFDC